jgi:hypothetical protein
LRRDPDQLGEPFSIFKSVFNEKVPFGSWIRRGLSDIPNVDSPLLGWLHEQLIVAHERDHFGVTVDGVLAKHLPRSNAPGIAHLVNDELNKRRIGCHDYSFPWGEQGLYGSA